MRIEDPPSSEGATEYEKRHHEDEAQVEHHSRLAGRLQHERFVPGTLQGNLGETRELSVDKRSV